MAHVPIEHLKSTRLRSILELTTADAFHDIETSEVGHEDALILGRVLDLHHSRTRGSGFFVLFFKVSRRRGSGFRFFPGDTGSSFNSQSAGSLMNGNSIC